MLFEPEVDLILVDIVVIEENTQSLDLEVLKLENSESFEPLFHIFYCHISYALIIIKISFILISLLIIKYMKPSILTLLNSKQINDSFNDFYFLLPFSEIFEVID
jgi:hypothetical protein